MKLELAEALVEHSNGELTLYEDYSGRGMYGGTTAGVSGSHFDYPIAIKRLTESLTNSEDEDDLDLLDELENYLENGKRDSLGLDTIWY